MHRVLAIFFFLTPLMITATELIRQPRHLHRRREACGRKYIAYEPLFRSPCGDVTYRARELGSNREVSVKVTKKAEWPSYDRRDIFFSKLLAQSRHMVSLHCATDDTIVMEYCSVNLRFMLDRLGFMVDAEMIFEELLPDLIEILAVLQVNDVVHTRFEPQFIMWCDGVFKLKGFNQAVKLQNETYRKRASFQTPDLYSAPEVLQGYVHRYSDMYSFGLVLRDLVQHSNIVDETLTELMNELLRDDLRSRLPFYKAYEYVYRLKAKHSSTTS